jgi:hypothetical protein
MKKRAALAAAIVMAGQSITPAFAGGLFNENTMLGWRQRMEPTAMAYVKLPFHASKADHRQFRAGVMVTTPRAYRPGFAPPRSSAPGWIDFSVTGYGLRSPWTTTLNVNGTLAWADNPVLLPKNTPHFSGTSWVLVGALSAGIIGGVIALSDRDK